jgi:hypothetical protein
MPPAFSKTGKPGDVAEEGYSILFGVFGRKEVGRLIDVISKIGSDSGVRRRGGVYAIRNLLSLSPAVRELAGSAMVGGLVSEWLGNGAFPVRGTLFDKTAGANWLVPWHQDLTICVAGRMDVPGYGPWTRKAGVWHVQPPVSILENMLSVRIHLDDCDEENGALRVLPGTHRLGRLNARQIAERQRSATVVSCTVQAGGVVLMRPLLLHSSGAAARAEHRRVIHIDYAASPLDDGLRWWGHSLPAQGDHGIDAGGAACGDVAGERGDGGDAERGGGHGEEVSGGDSE